jgi:archaetidylinositol phosphate synthase
LGLPVTNNVHPPYIRKLSGITADRERVILRNIAEHLPDWVSPNTLTGFGVFGAVLVCVGYVASYQSANILWLAVIGFIIHWFGDSLDGTVARLKQIERPRFGMFIDQASDFVSATFMIVGIGLSPWARLDVALATLAAYFLLAALVHLRAGVLGVYDVAHDGIGPTEGRMFMIVLTLMMMAQSPGSAMMIFQDFTILDCVLSIMVFWAALTFIREMTKVGRMLAKEEPQRKSR